MNSLFLDLPQDLQYMYKDDLTVWIFLFPNTEMKPQIWKE